MVDDTGTTHPDDGIVVLGAPGVDLIDRDEVLRLLGFDRPVAPAKWRSHERDADMSVDVDGDDEGFAVLVVAGAGDEARPVLDLKFEGVGDDYLVRAMIGDGDAPVVGDLRAVLSSLRRTTASMTVG